MPSPRRREYRRRRGPDAQAAEVRSSQEGRMGEDLSKQGRADREDGLRQIQDHRARQGRIGIWKTDRPAVSHGVLRVQGVRR